MPERSLDLEVFFAWLVILVSIVKSSTAIPLADQSNLLPSPGVCGHTLINSVDTNSFATVGQYPALALVEYAKSENKTGFHCSGALINDRYILTAAHCVGHSIPKTWTVKSVRLGEWNLNTNPDCDKDVCADTVRDIPVEEEIIHEDYDRSSRSKSNDIALLRLTEPVTFTKWLSPLCLPQTESDNSNRTSSNIFSGWSKHLTSDDGTIKRHFKLDDFDFNECKKIYAEMRINLEPSQICAGGSGGVGTCLRDGGGPLMKLEEVNGQSYLFAVGIASLGPTPCGTAGLPDIFTNVSSFMDWINSKIRA